MANANSNLVLVVEDEPLILMTLEDMFMDAGFEVVTASDAAEALQALNDNKADIRLICSDNNMPPGPGGDTVLRAAAEICPRAARIMISANEPKDVAEYTDAYFAKPCPPSLVMAKVNQLLQASA